MTQVLQCRAKCFTASSLLDRLLVTSVKSRFTKCNNTEGASGSLDALTFFLCKSESLQIMRTALSSWCLALSWRLWQRVGEAVYNYVVAAWWGGFSSIELMHSKKHNCFHKFIFILIILWTWYLVCSKSGFGWTGCSIICQSDIGNALQSLQKRECCFIPHSHIFLSNIFK